ncbi:hypothetical protein [Synechococcus sp. ATX 2A4]|uniref:hypothetical protein n=1 Tax=Synechococcus sp. ATX 2A4 TaxID=2823727 RepID=UPI0020CD45D2|nr:hypothetical protein [Synechococcus sp. ATX 2A4]
MTPLFMAKANSSCGKILLLNVKDAEAALIRGLVMKDRFHSQRWIRVVGALLLRAGSIGAHPKETAPDGACSSSHGRSAALRIARGSSPSGRTWSFGNPYIVSYEL